MLLRVNLKKVHEVKECNEKWCSYEPFKGVTFLMIDATWECAGEEGRIMRVFRKNVWEEIEKQGYYMG